MATLSEKEWRSAVEEIRGANGSWTWTMSNGVEASRFLTASPEPKTTTSWPRRSSSSETRLTYSLTAFRVPRRCGVTWAIERRSADTAAAYEPALDGPPAQASVFASAVRLRGAGHRALASARTWR